MKKLSVLLLLISLSLACAKSEKKEELKTDEIAIINTDFGEIYVLLYDETPLHKENFMKLAKEGFYDSTTFHRVIEEFMIQGGDPNSKDEIPFNDGQGGPGYTINAEFNTKFIHKKGALAAARLGDQQNPEKKSSGSQFYIVQGTPMDSTQIIEMTKQSVIAGYIQAPENADLLAKLRRNQAAGRMDSVEIILSNVETLLSSEIEKSGYTSEQINLYQTIGGTPFLDGNYTVFGEVIKGLDIIDTIAAQETGQADRPVNKILMTVRVEEMEREKITSEFGYSYN